MRYGCALLCPLCGVGSAVLRKLRAWPWLCLSAVMMFAHLHSKTLLFVFTWLLLRVPSKYSVIAANQLGRDAAQKDLHTEQVLFKAHAVPACMRVQAALKL